VGVGEQRWGGRAPRAPPPTALPGPNPDTVRLPDNGLDKEAVDIRIMERQPCQFVRLKESL
jgi:hypothetical protein